MFTAIVTGATRGIGYGIAEALIKAGAKVMITGRDTGGVAEAVGRLETHAGGKGFVLGRAVDVREREAVDALVVETVKEFGALNTLINNAGVGLFTEVEKTTDEDWARVIDTNLTGVFYCSRAAIPAMRHAGGGWIINIASLAGRNYFANGAA
ncbi:MAG TPA: SDR family NAD(P)-dependent oxidoreductase, partial [Vicinamibacterales bacterium]|nr:SDR family NAD(P)-dependent oxidoreductase [Vicinamibacterales bacterium]